MPAFMRLDGIDGEVIESRPSAPDSFTYSKPAGSGDDVIVDGRIITGENPATVSGEGRPGENMSLNFTRIDIDTALLDDVGGALVILGDGSVRDTHGDFDLI